MSCFHSKMVESYFCIRLLVMGYALMPLFLLCRGLGGELMRPAGKYHSWGVKAEFAIMNSSVYFFSVCFIYIALNA